MATCSEAMGATYADAVSQLVDDIVAHIAAAGMCGQLVTTCFSKGASLGDIMASLEATDFDIIVAGDALHHVTTSKGADKVRRDTSKVEDQLTSAETFADAVGAIAASAVRPLGAAFARHASVGGYSNFAENQRWLIERRDPLIYLAEQHGIQLNTNIFHLNTNIIHLKPV